MILAGNIGVPQFVQNRLVAAGALAAGASLSTGADAGAGAAGAAAGCGFGFIGDPSGLIASVSACLRGVLHLGQKTKPSANHGRKSRS